jgi:chromosome segregation protein
LYLSKLEIFGFKSFANKTVINFNEGITSIVGPNGCGKTNIVDAIRWCLGEQRSGALRSDKMENVIFNGTKTKKPMGMAEVSLTIENTKGVLPTEYTDVTITRRIFRSGESEYLLNKNLCRLKDITNLFLDTGIGANAYSVIELKMVETILSSKAEERRTMFEEAAGVNKYKLRRRLALRKLDEVKSDLVRVNDIVSEVEKKVNSLERQAKKADRYNKITASLRELELELAERELALFHLHKEQALFEKDNSFKQKVLLESRSSQIEDEIRVIKEELTEIENQLKQKRFEVSLLVEKIYNNQKSVSVSEERKKSLGKNIDRYSSELNELNAQLEETKKSIADAAVYLTQTDQKISAKQKDKEEFEESISRIKDELEKRNTSLKLLSDNLLELFKEITNKENELSNIENSLIAKNGLINKLNEKIQSLTGNIAKTVGFIEQLNEEKREAEEKLSQAESIYLRKQQEKENLEKELTALKEAELEKKSVLNAIRDKINFVQTLIDNLEGVSKGAKALLEDNSWTKADKTLLAHIGNTKEEYKFAIEAALKNNLNNILIESLDDIKNGIEYLNAHNIGKASFFLVNHINSKRKTLIKKYQEYQLKKKLKSLKGQKGVVGVAANFIETQTKWRHYFDRLLSKTILVDELSTAFKLYEKFPQFNYATLNGDFIDRSGVIEAGATPRLDDTFFGRKQLLENLKSDFPHKEKELAKLKKLIAEKEEKLNSINLKVLSERGRMLVNDLANVEKQIAQFEYEKNKAVDEIEKIRQEIQELAEDFNKLDNQRASLSANLSALKADKQKADEDHESFEKEFNSINEEFNLRKNNLNSINLELERLSGEKKNTLNAKKRSEDSIELINKTISKRMQDISSAQEELESISNFLKEKQLEYQKLEEERENLINQEAEIDSRYKAVKTLITEKEINLNGIRKEKEAKVNEIHTAEMRINEYDIKVANLKTNISESYSVHLQLKKFDDLDSFDFSRRSEEVHSLKQRIKNLGPINLLAYSEYEVEKERLDFLTKQRNDLTDSEKDIVKTIEEINSTAQAQFMETFEKIRAHFVNIFRGLFNPGDEADLKLEENADPLEAKIEIIAKPKGKRPTSIELLSGGEKTLTAIALLFAIYLVKPSPFCILDEIDAPLDDANIDRFTKIINDFSKDTQFVVVTHNKRTMEAADTLYGVTMQEEGISKLVGVRFNEDLNLVS